MLLMKQKISVIVLISGKLSEMGEKAEKGQTEISDKILGSK